MQSARTEQDSHWHVMTGSHVMLSRTTFLSVTAGVYSVGAGCQSVRAKTLADGPTWAAIANCKAIPPYGPSRLGAARLLHTHTVCLHNCLSLLKAYTLMKDP
jgi:hypothetical protein